MIDGEGVSVEAGAQLDSHLQGTGRSLSKTPLPHSDKHVSEIPAEAVPPEVARRLVAFCEDLTNDCATMAALLGRLVSSKRLGEKVAVVRPLKYVSKLISAARELLALRGDHQYSKARENSGLHSDTNEFVLRNFIGIFRTPSGDEYAKATLGDKLQAYQSRFVPVYRVYTNKEARESLQDLLTVLEGLEKFSLDQLETQVLGLSEEELSRSPLLAKAARFNQALYNAVGQSNMHISSMVSALDRVASSLQAAGLMHEAAELDTVSNSIEAWFGF